MTTISQVPVSLEFREGTLTLAGVSESALARLFDQVPWSFDPRAGVFRTDAHWYPRVRLGLERLAAPYTDHVRQWPTISLPAAQLHPLRPEQQAAVDAWNLHQGRGTLEMPTGTGKTEVALTLLGQRQTPTLIVSPVRDLMYQWHRRLLAAFKIDAGIIGDRIYRVEPISVTTYDSACIHMPTLGNRFDFLIFDECHHLAGPMRLDAARMSVARYRLGLTATYERADGAQEQLEPLIGSVVYRLPVSAVRGRSLADYQVVRIPIHLADQEQARFHVLSEQIRRYVYDRRQLDPHFTWEQMCQESNADPEARRIWIAYQEKRSIEDRAEEKLRVLEDLFRLHAGEPVIVFAGSNSMARDVSMRFLIPCLLNHCQKRERLDILQGLENGSYPAIVCNRVLDEGVDLPEVKVAIVIGGMASDRQAKQRLGRVLRKRGNQRAVLYEVVTETPGEIERSRRRRQSDAYEGTRHRRL